MNVTESRPRTLHKKTSVSKYGVEVISLEATPK